MTHRSSWFAEAAAASLHHFERGRAVSMARLAAVTRQVCLELEVRATAAQATMAEVVWAEAGRAEGYTPTRPG